MLKEELFSDAVLIIGVTELVGSIQSVAEQRRPRGQPNPSRDSPRSEIQSLHLIAQNNLSHHTHTHTYTNTQIHKYTNTHTHTHTHMQHAHTQTCLLSLAVTLSSYFSHCFHTIMYIACRPYLSDTCTHIHSHTHTCMLHTHIHTHVQSFPVNLYSILLNSSWVH